MDIRYQNNCNNIPWRTVPYLLKKVGMGYTTPTRHKQSFEASYSVIFAFDGESLVAFGRILSDGVRQSAIYDIVVAPNYQGQGLGREILSKLMNTTPNCNFILYASPGKEGFYKTMGYLKMKTSMARFIDNNSMIEKGFLDK